MVQRSIEKKDFHTALNYLNQILIECHASMGHVILKFQCMIKEGQVKEALAYAQGLLRERQFTDSATLLLWVGRL